MNSLGVSLAVLAAAVVFSFLAGLFTRNYSQVDRLWSVLPPVYVLIWLPGFTDNPRFLIAAFLVLAWGIRLTWNFARRGGYAWEKGRGFTGEDYRWEVLRGRIPNRFLFELFNLSFISFFQLALVFAITFPVYLCGLHNSPLTPLDGLLFLLHMLLLFTETAADNQQFAFHRDKGKPENRNNPRYALGFNTLGLWERSRHPNYLCEMSQWVVVFLYAVSAAGTLLPSPVPSAGLAPLILIVLFTGSTVMTEGITLSKYPRFREWRKVTPPWIPVSLPGSRRRRREFLEKLGS